MSGNVKTCSFQFSARCFSVIVVSLLNIGFLCAQPEVETDSTGLTIENKEQKAGSAEADSGSSDSLFFANLEEAQVFQRKKTELCDELAETALHCFRDLKGLSIADIGFPGTRTALYSLETFAPVQYVPIFSFIPGISPYNTGGMIGPGNFKPDGPGGTVFRLEEVWTIPALVDTPLTRLDWARGAFEMNLFRLSVSRMLGMRSYLLFDFVSDGADDIDYFYTFQVHQPYLSGLAGLDRFWSGLKRDSASVVVEGESQYISSMHFRPRVGFGLGSGSVVELFVDRYKNESDLVSPRDSLEERDLYDELVQKSFPAEFYALTLGRKYLYRHPLFLSSFHVFHSIIEKKEDGFNPGPIAGASGSGFYHQEFSGTVQEVRASAAFPDVFSGPRLVFTGRNQMMEGPFSLYSRADSTGYAPGSTDMNWSDVQELVLRADPEWAMLRAGITADISRHSLMHDERKILGGYSVTGRLDLPLGFGLLAGNGYAARQPGWNRMYTLNSMRFQYPTPDLSHETIFNYRCGLAWNRGKVNLETVLNFNTMKDVIMSRALPFRIPPDTGDSVHTAPDVEALKLINYEREKRNTLVLRAGIRLGNWDLSLENAFLLHNRISGPQIDWQRRRTNPTLPGSICKGHLGWGNRFVNDRLGVKITWDWEWYAMRFGWAPRLDGYSQVVKLDEYIALDFTAQMQIKQFILYYQIKNFNHDRYYLEPGSHPPGVNFRWGVNWVLNG
jgi:hypothetical protein